MLIDTIHWSGDFDTGHTRIIDQTKLPSQKVFLDISNVEEMYDAIFHLKVRGAPAIGIAAAYGLILGMRNIREKEHFFDNLEKMVKYIGSSRPTAVNLFWALERMKKKAFALQHKELESIKEQLLIEANTIKEEDNAVCHELGRIGSGLLPHKANVLTHCNAGGLATSGYGTALAVFFHAFSDKKDIHVYADETRPLWQGARLTTWELKEAGIPVTLICDNTAGFLMQQGKIDMVFVGADRVASNGDVANKIGTYSVAVLAHVHNIPFYVVAPISTFDFTIESGKDIKIEQRAAAEVTHPYSRQIAPDGVEVYSPAFDITPAFYISGIVTEKGIIEKPNKQNISLVLKD